MTSRLKKLVLRMMGEEHAREQAAPVDPGAAPSVEELAIYAEALLRGKPYFGRVMCALQIAPERARCFLPVLRRLSEMKSGPIEILEIGSWAGSSAIAWADALKKVERAGHVTCVDQWRPYFDLSRDKQPSYEEMNRAASSGDVLRLFRHNIRAAGHDDVIAYRQMPSTQVSTVFAQGSFDLVFVDGDHRYHAAIADIDAAKRVLRAPGIICGDDLELTLAEVDEREHRQVVADGIDAVLSAHARRGYHPGVTQAVGEAFVQVSIRHGFWAVWTDGCDWRPLDFELPSAAKPSAIVDTTVGSGA